MFVYCPESWFDEVFPSLFEEYDDTDDMSIVFEPYFVEGTNVRKGAL
jgi:hypothetical protein